MRPFLPAALLSIALAFATPGRAGAAEGTPAILPPSVKIRPLLIPVVADGRIEKYTQFEVLLEVADSTRLGDVQVSIPKLHDAILTAVYHGIDEGWIVRGNIANLPALRRMIDDSNSRLVGKNVISRIIITPLARQSPLS